MKKGMEQSPKYLSYGNMKNWQPTSDWAIAKKDGTDFNWHKKSHSK